MVSGLNPKSAVAITSLSEGLTCLVGLITYHLLNGFNFNYQVGLALMLGALLSIPLAVYTVSKVEEKRFKTMVSISILTLGILTFLKTYNKLIVISNLPLIIASSLIAIPLGYQIGKNRNS